MQIQVDNLEADVRRLCEAGMKFQGGIVKGLVGEQILLDDPSGNPIELFEPATKVCRSWRRRISTLDDTPILQFKVFVARYCESIGDSIVHPVARQSSTWAMLKSTTASR